MTIFEPARAGDTYSSLAATRLNDPTRFREILDLTSEPARVFENPPAGAIVELPTLQELYPIAAPKLGAVSQSVRGATTNLTQRATALTGQITGKIESIAGKLPPELQGYSTKALNAIASVNSAIGQVESEIDEILGRADDLLRGYGGSSVRLVDWLLIADKSGTIGKVQEILTTARSLLP